MILSFRPREQFGNVVIAEPLPEAERSRFGAIGFGRGRLEHFIEPDPQRFVHDLLEGPFEPRGSFSGFGRDIRIKRQGGSHAGIMMLHLEPSNRQIEDTGLGWLERRSAA